MRGWIEFLFWLILMGIGHILIGATETVFLERRQEHAKWCIKTYKANKKKYNFKTKKQLKDWCQKTYDDKYKMKKDNV